MSSLWVTRRQIEASKAYFGEFYSIEDARAECRYNREQWRKAIVMLWTTQRGALEEAPIWQRYAWRLGCSLAMILGRLNCCNKHDRPYPDRLSYLRTEDMGYWDNRSDGYGWSAQTLEFHPWRIRYAIGSDGECTM